MVNLRLTSWAIFNQNHPILTQKVVNFRDFCLKFWKNVNFGPLWKPLVKVPNTKYVFKTFSAPLEALKKALEQRTFSTFDIIRTQFCILLNPYNIYIIWLFIQLLSVLFIFQIFYVYFVLILESLWVHIEYKPFHSNNTYN